MRVPASRSTPEPQARPPDTVVRRILRDLRAQYLEIDRRQLGVFRIYFGAVLLADLRVRLPTLSLFYTNDGALPNHFALFAPMSSPIFSVFFACSTKGEVEVAFALTALVYAALMVGYRTRLMQILTAILYPSLIARNLFFEMGGTCCLALMASYTLFLPLGDRFSVDALLVSLARRPERLPSELNEREGLRSDGSPHRSIIVLGLLLQVTGIYFFNAVQKFGDDWRSGQAVHWVLWQNRIATSLCGWLRQHEPAWFSPLFTYATLTVEGVAPFMLLTPIVWRWTRSIYFVAAVSFHAGIALLTDVGPYSYAMFGFDLLILPGFWFDALARRLARGRVARTVAYDPADAGLHRIARLLARLDTLELLRFVDRAATSGDLAPAPAGHLAVRAEGGPWRLDALGLKDALRATPTFAFLGFALDRRLFALALRSRGRAARLFEWSSGAPETEGVTPAAALRRARFPRVTAGLREGLATVFVAISILQLLHDNWWLAGRFPRWMLRGPPGALADVPIYLRQLQSWSMFPDPPHDDLTIVVDAETVGGLHIDPMTGKPPDLGSTLRDPPRYGQYLCDYFVRIANPGFRGYLPFFGHYLTHWQEIEGRPPEDRLQRYRVLVIQSASPMPGERAPTHLRTSVLLEGP